MLRFSKLQQVIANLKPTLGYDLSLAIVIAKRSHIYKKDIDDTIFWFLLLVIAKNLL